MWTINIIMSSHPVRQLTSYSHELHLLQRKESAEGHLRHHSRSFLVASGSLLGFFYTPVHLTPDDSTLFLADFDGFFQQHQTEDRDPHLFFEGTIEGLEVISINGDEDDQRVKIMQGNSFKGVFKGVVRKYQERCGEQCFLEDLKAENVLITKEEKELIIPVFSRFQLKKINSVSLEKASAIVSGNLVIDIQLSPNIFYNIETFHKKAAIIMALNRENPIELPITRKGHSSEGDTDIEYQFKEEKGVMRYSIRKLFHAEVQSTYKQFFTPFNELYLKIVVTLLDLTVHFPKEAHHLSRVKDSRQNRNISSGEKSSNSSRRRGNFRNQPEKKKVTIKFTNFDLKDYVEDNNPYTPFNEFFKYQRTQDLIRSRMTKINFISQSQTGDFRVATNNLALFPYYKQFLENSTRRNSNFRWSLGLLDRNKDIVKPEVRSIREQYEYRSEHSMKGECRIFKPVNWNHTHIEIPIFKYWMIYFLQICCPLLLLATITMYVYLQGNGANNENERNIFNQRVSNVIDILLAIAAMIPVFRNSTSKATTFSFFYIIIYLAVIPLILVLITSVLDIDVNNEDFLKTYRPLMDPFFLAAFVLLICIILIVFVVVILASCQVFTVHQVIRRPRAISFKKFKDAQEPRAFLEMIEKTNKSRGGQFRYSVVRDVDLFGNFIPDLEKGGPNDIYL